MSGDRLAHFFYILLRDHLPAGAVEAILSEHVEAAGEREVVYSNQHLADYARELAASLDSGAAEENT